MGWFSAKTRSVLRNRQGIPRLSRVSSRAHEAGMRELWASGTFPLSQRNALNTKRAGDLMVAGLTGEFSGSALRTSLTPSWPDGSRCASASDDGKGLRAGFGMRRPAFSLSRRLRCRPPIRNPFPSPNFWGSSLSKSLMRLRRRLDHVGPFFGNHDDRCVRVTGDHRRHDRRVDDAQSLQSAHSHSSSTTAIESLPILHVPMT